MCKLMTCNNQPQVDDTEATFVDEHSLVIGDDDEDYI